MDTFFSHIETEGAEETSHSIHRHPANLRTSVGRRTANPLAPLELPDNRTYQLEEVRILDSHVASIRWSVEIEAQMNGRGDNFYFRIHISYEAIKRGELEAQGYDSTCDRNTAILLLARRAIRSHLLLNRHPPRFSMHYRPVELVV
jgi:hypothetical protein